MAKPLRYVHQINVRLDQDTFDRLVIATDEADIAMGEWVRDLIRAHLPDLEAGQLPEVYRAATPPLPT
jgi:hypothetical protein